MSFSLVLPTDAMIPSRSEHAARILLLTLFVLPSCVLFIVLRCSTVPIVAEWILNNVFEPDAVGLMRT
jgi:hypothetical protein